MASNSNPTSFSAQPVRRESDIVYQGNLLKRGEHIKNWRTRYFVLFRDGALLGFKIPPTNGDYSDPCNDFTVKDVQFMKVEHPRPNTFLIRGLQWTQVIERTFCAESSESRDTWLNAMQMVADSLKGGAVPAPAAGDAEVMDTEMVDVSNLPTAMEPGTYDSNIHGSLSTTDNVFDVPGLPNHGLTSKVTLVDFTFVKMLGVGSFGKVILGRERVSGKFYAIKLLKKKVIVEKDEVNHTYTESRVLLKCKHPFLTSMAYSFQTKDRLCFVMDFAIGGDLYYHLNTVMRAQRSGFSEDRSRFYAAEIACGLGYLHSNNIVYRDLKLENVLLDKDGHVKIADFGLCKENISHKDRTQTFCGTPEYLAPEVLEDNDYGRAVDWWGLGVVVYEMVCGRLPFFNADHDKLFELIMRANIRYPTRLTPVCRDFLSSLMTKKPNRRLGGGPGDFLEVKAHPFFAGLDWDKLILRELTPPFIPDLKDETDTKYFDAEFTGKPVQLTPPAARNGPLDAIDENDDELQSNFTQFSFHDERQHNDGGMIEDYVEAVERMEM
uniref:non-specific serine/threonine protein kinase n=1 Tax=Panagrellus redivivus TaxID=6233 RepID=A0A7E4ZZ97_PANRE